MNSPLGSLSKKSADGFSPQRASTGTEAETAVEAHDQEPASSGREHRSRGLMANLRRGYRLLRELLTQKPSTARRSQLPYKSPRFADAASSWRLALDWLIRVTRQLRLEELPAPVFDRHGCFERLEPRRLLGIEGLLLNNAAAGGGKNPRQQLQWLRDRILQIAGSGDLLRALSDKLLVGASTDDDGGNWGDNGGGRGPAPGPRRDLLQLPLTYETMSAFQHPEQQHHHHLNMHLPHFSSHHHNHPHLPTQAQASLARCEENFSAFHRFLARILTWPPPTAAGACGGVDDDDDGGACELRVALGKQCAECNAVCLLLRNNHQLSGHSQLPFHHLHHQESQVPGAGGPDSALSVLLLHLLTLMLLLDEPLPPKQRAEVLQLWEHRLQPSALADLPRTREMRRRYRELMSS